MRRLCEKKESEEDEDASNDNDDDLHECEECGRDMDPEEAEEGDGDHDDGGGARRQDPLVGQVGPHRADGEKQEHDEAATALLKEFASVLEKRVPW